MRACAISLIAALSVVSACREIDLVHDVPAFEWPTGSPRRLTFNVGDDRNPVWSPGGDSIYYSAQGYPGIPLGRGILVAAPADGGQVRALYPFLHSTPLGPRYHLAPMPAPDGERMLFLEIVGEAAPAECRRSDVATECPGPAPLLQRAHLVVRALDEGSAAPAQIAVVDLPGRASRAAPPPYSDESYPYHQLYRNGRVAFTASWAPDSRRVVFSNGLQLFLWTPGAGEPEPLPGTEHALHPAWAPDGVLIAFMRLRPTTSLAHSCTCDEEGNVRPVIRTVHEAGTAQLELVRPDGVHAGVLGAGEDPAWGPDGSLYARRDGAIVRIDVATGTAQAIAGTDHGAEPAVSPDGSRLAFTHLPAAGGSDVWVVDLDTH